MKIAIPHRSSAQYMLAQYLFSVGPQTRNDCLDFLDLHFTRKNVLASFRRAEECAQIILVGNTYDICSQFKEFFSGYGEEESYVGEVVRPREVGEFRPMVNYEANIRRMHRDDGRKPMTFLPMQTS